MARNKKREVHDLKPSILEGDGPRLVNPFPVKIDLTGKLFAWDGVQPVFFLMPESPHFYLPCFSTKEHLQSFMSTVRVFMGRAGNDYVGIKQILDGDEFLRSFRSAERKVYRIILDPYFTPRGTLRYTQVAWPSREDLT